AAELKTVVSPAPRRWSVWLYLLVGVLIGAAATWSIARRVAPVADAKPATPFEWRDHPVWKGFFGPGASTRLVVGVPFMVTAGGVFARDTQVNRVEEIRTSKALQS